MHRQLLAVIACATLAVGACDEDPDALDEPHDAARMSDDASSARDAARDSTTDAGAVNDLDATRSSFAEGGPLFPGDAHAPTDASTSDAASDANCARVTADAGSLGCSARLCTRDGATWVTLYGSDPWRVGGLSWLASICTDSLGWPRHAASDGSSISYPVEAAQRSALRAGAPLYVEWAGPTDTPSERALLCPLVDHDQSLTCTFE